MAAMVKAGSPGPVAISRTECPGPIRASSTRACVTGANICRMISRCFSQKGAESRHAFTTSGSGCINRSIPTGRLAASPPFKGLSLFESDCLNPDCLNPLDKLGGILRRDLENWSPAA